MNKGFKRLTALILTFFTSINTFHLDVFAIGYQKWNAQTEIVLTEEHAESNGDNVLKETDISVENKTIVTDGETEIEVSKDRNAIATSNTSGFCGNNATYTLTEGVLSIDGEGAINDSAFKDNAQIEIVVISENITLIGENAFYNCNNLKKIVVPDKVESIGEYAFYECDNLVSAELGAGVSSLGTCAFGYCDALKRLKIGSNITKGASNAFRNTGNNIQMLTVGEKAVKIDSEFYHFSGLKEINVEEGNTGYSSVDGVLYNKDQTLLVRYPQSHTGELYTVADTVTTIEAEGFYKNDILTEVILPEGLEKIGENAFYNCNNLKKIVVPDKVESIGEYAFYECDNLVSAELGAGVSSLGTCAFGYCDALKKLKIGSNITKGASNAFRNTGNNIQMLTVGEKAVKIDSEFYHFSGLKEINVEEGNTGYSSVDGVLYNKDQTLLVKYPHSKEDTSYMISRTTEIITEGAFKNNDYIMKVTIPDSVYKISDYAFYDCDNLSSVIIPDSITIIGSYAFYSCDQLIAIQVPESIEIIGNNSFGSISDLVIYCTAGSKIAEYASSSNIEYLTSSCCIIFTLNKQYAVLDRNSEQKLEDSIKNYNVIIENNTSNTILTNFCINKESIILNASSISAGDMLTIKLTSKKGDTIAFEKSFILDENMNATLDLVVCQKGCISTTIKTKINGCMLIYDKDGNLQASLSIGNGYKKSMYLEKGEYQVILIQGNSDFWNFDKISVFDDKGLLEGREYILKQAIIEDGVICNLGDITLINLDTDDLMYLDSSKSEYSSNITTAKTGALLSFRVSYAFKQSRVDEVGNMKVRISIPSECEYISGSVTIDGVAMENINRSGSYIIIPVTKKEGIIRFTLKPVSVGTVISKAQILFVTGEKNYIENIGSMSFDIPYISLFCNGTTSDRTIKVSGYAVPGEIVAIYDGTKRIGTAVSNKAGNWSQTVTLYNVFNKSNHSITAKIYTGTTNEVSSEERIVYYGTKIVTVKEFFMYYNNHNNAKLDLLEYQNNKKRISFNPAYPFTFTVKLSNQDCVENVYIVSTKTSGVKQLKAAYDEASDIWIASGYFDENNHHYVPGNLSVQFSAPENSSVDVNSEEYLMTEDEFNILPAEFKNASIIVDENTFDDSESGTFTSRYTLDNDEKTEIKFKYTRVMLSDVGAISARGFSGKTAYGIKDDAEFTSKTREELEKEGYVQLDTTDPHLIYYAKMEYDVDGNTSMKVYKFLNGVEGYNPTEYLAIEALTKGYDLVTNTEGGGDLVSSIVDTVSFFDDTISYKEKMNLAKDAIVNSNLSETEKQARLDKLKEIKELHATYTLMKIMTFELKMFNELLLPPGISTIANLAIGLAEDIYQDAVDELFDEIILQLINFDMKWTIDPSGYVYEAVANNRLSNVTVTIYYKDESGNIIKWDAEEYEQMNPLITDSAGAYAWDVPEGQWQVKYELEGYETAYSEWMSVPPIRLDVNIGLTSKAAPKVEMTELYDTYAVVTFDKYMNIDSVITSGVLQIKDNSGVPVSLAVDSVDAIKNAEGIMLAKSFKLTYSKLLQTGKYTLEIGKSVKSYAGINLAETYQVSLVAGKAIEDINIENSASITSGELVKIPVKLTPAEKFDATVICSSSMDDIASVESISEVNEDGVAYVEINPKLPGNIILTVGIKGTSIYKEINLKILSNIVKKDNDDELEKNILMDNVFINDISDQIYTGKKITPEIVISYNGSILVENVDYIVSYNDNQTAGIATVTVSGIGNYSGTQTKTFKILLKTPTLSSVSNTSKGVTVKWAKVTAAAKYRVFRKSGSGNWAKVGDTTSTSYTDTTAKSGITYTYSVRCLSSDGKSYTSSYDKTGKSIKYLAKPKLASVSNTASGVTLKWAKVTGASGYYVYRKNSSGSYSKIATIKSGSTLNYKDTAVKSKNGKKYIYTVRAYSGKTLSSYENGKTIVRLTSSSISSLKNSASKKMAVKWTQNSKATGYQVQYSTSSKFSNATTKTITGYKNVSKTITNLKKGKTYYVRVCSYKTVSGVKYYSGWSTVKSVKISK